MNNNYIFRGPSDPKHEHYKLIKEIDTKIAVCLSSGKRILANAVYQVHCREVRITAVLDIAPEIVKV